MFFLYDEVVEPFSSTLYLVKAKTLITLLDNLVNDCMSARRRKVDRKADIKDHTSMASWLHSILLVRNLPPSQSRAGSFCKSFSIVLTIS